MIWRGLTILLFALLSSSSLAQPLVEKISVDSSEALLSAKVTLLFEETKRNDEDIEIFAPPRIETRDAVLQQIEKDRWEVLIQLHAGDREKRPMLTCVLMTANGTPIGVPNRVLQRQGSVTESSPGTLDCLRDTTILSPAEVTALSKEERAAFIRSREDDSSKFAAEINSELTEEVAARLFALERKAGLSPAAALNRRLTVDEISRRLVTLESVWAVEKK